MGGCCTSCCTSCCTCCCVPEDSTNWDFPRARRLVLAQDKLATDPAVTCIEEYVEMPDGYVLFTRCYIPTTAYNASSLSNTFNSNSNSNPNPSSDIKEDPNNVNNSNNDNNNDINQDNNNSSSNSTSTSVKGMLCYNHGFADHINGLNHELGLEWCRRGYIFFMQEHFGCGRSDGLYVYCDNFNLLVKHSSFIHKYAKLKYSKLFNIPNNGYFVGGESLGGGLTIHQIIYENEIEINNAVNSNSNIDNYNIPEWNGMYLAAPMCSIDKNIRPPECIENIFRNCIIPCCPKINGAPAEDLNPFFLSPDAPNKAKKMHFEINPMMYESKPRLATAGALLNATDYIEKNGNKINIPMIIIHSKDDKVTSPDASQMFFKNASSTIKEFKLYDKGWHLIWHDCVKDKAYNDVENWIQTRINAED